MKKQLAFLLCLLLLIPFAASCSAAPAPAAETPAPAETAAPTPETTPVPTPETTPVPTPEPSPEPVGGHYVFQPKVCSSYMTALFGETMTETWFRLVDAVMAGEDTFACPDSFTYDWVMGQYPERCFPVLRELIDYGWDRSHPVKDGVASFTYLVPKEEAAARIAEFAALVEGILNETLQDDYSDFEKALALYLYFSDHYVYDYAAAEPDANPDYLTSYRVLTTGTGICQEFSVAYSYLLLQAGVDASTMSGHRSYDGASHQWSYVKLNGHNYHVDPTYVIGSGGALEYFLMDDAQREAADCYTRSDFVLCSCYAQEYGQPHYTADDDSFRALWRGWFLELDHGASTLSYSAWNDRWEYVAMSFDYTGW